MRWLVLAHPDMKAVRGGVIRNPGHRRKQRKTLGFGADGILTTAYHDLIASTIGAKFGPEYRVPRQNAAATTKTNRAAVTLRTLLTLFIGPGGSRPEAA